MLSKPFAWNLDQSFATRIVETCKKQLIKFEGAPKGVGDMYTAMMESMSFEEMLSKTELIEVY